MTREEAFLGNNSEIDISGFGNAQTVPDLKIAAHAN